MFVSIPTPQFSRFLLKSPLLRASGSRFICSLWRRYNGRNQFQKEEGIIVVVGLWAQTHNARALAGPDPGFHSNKEVIYSANPGEPETTERSIRRYRLSIPGFDLVIRASLQLLLAEFALKSAPGCLMLHRSVR
ncbi:hypothetical protein NDU88_002564 [Pleurodeles waltl]|uniref:Uncharacterized protein n=1 Tax=Pleurodeles waltl TaxID=8319 RepID=A0AAV7Q6D1_PLEWA|nr:hypothetical protein NDU88_002564 [Pleurodeles waltl]